MRLYEVCPVVTEKHELNRFFVIIHNYTSFAINKNPVSASGLHCKSLGLSLVDSF